MVSRSSTNDAGKVGAVRILPDQPSDPRLAGPGSLGKLANVAGRSGGVFCRIERLLTCRQRPYDNQSRCAEPAVPPPEGVEAVRVSDSS
jgi:hypothetical protein